ncbi:MAG: TetR/AcrR family transcriptional regulator [Acidimicrobiia bacterium]
MFEKLDHRSNLGRVNDVDHVTTKAEVIPDPPWWDAPNRGASRSTLTRDAIVTAAIDVLDEVGLEGLSMRRVAAELDTGAASLYWHVADKEQLIHLVLDRVMEELQLPEPDPSRWEEQVREFARAARTMFASHRDLALASMGRVPMGPSLVRITEWFLALLRGAGIPNLPATWFPDLFALVGAAQAVEDDIVAHTDDPMTQRMGEYLSSLPADEFPNITAVLPEMVAGDSDERFEFAVDLMIRGLGAFVEE